MKKFFPLALCIGLVGCTTSGIIIALDSLGVALVAASEVSGLSPIESNYLDDAGTFADCVGAALQTGGTNAQVGTAIGACGIAAVAPNLPPGTPTTIINVIAAVDKAIQGLVNEIKPIQMASNHIEVPLTESFGPHANDKFKMGFGGKNHIKKVRAEIATAKANLKNAKH
jgi:hypothetical protein